MQGRIVTLEEYERIQASKGQNSNQGIVTET